MSRVPGMMPLMPPPSILNTVTVFPFFGGVGWSRHSSVVTKQNISEMISIPLVFGIFCNLYSMLCNVYVYVCSVNAIYMCLVINFVYVTTRLLYKAKGYRNDLD